MARPDVFNPLVPRPDELLDRYQDDEVAQIAGDWKEFVYSLASLMLWLGQKASLPLANLLHSTRPPSQAQALRAGQASQSIL